jgi:hypothetical protein
MRSGKEPLKEVAPVDSLGVSHVYKPDKQGHIEVAEEFQEIVTRLREAGFVAVKSEKEPD